MAATFNQGKAISDNEKEYIKAHFRYDEKTGKISRNDRKNSNGSLDKDGYLIMKVKTKQYKAHRLAWFLYYNVFPEKEIDHINHIRTDNRISNLREADRLTNIDNSVRQRNKDTGVVGVYIDKSTDGLKKAFTTRLAKKTYRFYSLEEAVNFRIKNNKNV